MTTLVTGGAGFIGSNLVEDLLASGKDVIVLDSMTTGSRSNLANLQNLQNLQNSRNVKGRLNIIQASCNDLQGLDPNPEEIYHLGIPSSSPMYKKDPMLVGEAVNGSIAVFELARKCGSRIVYASSSSLYNGISPPHKEDMQILVTDYYTEARLAIERLAELYKRLFNVGSVGMRFFSVYGPKEEAKKKYANMVSQFLWDLRAKRAPVIYGDGSQTRDFTYVKDIVRALVMAMDSGHHGIFNAGTGVAYSFNDVVELLNDRLGLHVTPQYIENPIKNYVGHTLADTSRAKEVLGFEARYTLEKGLDDLLENCG
jgi:UDP-glucose 4-epimerase